MIEIKTEILYVAVRVSKFYEQRKFFVERINHHYLLY